MNFILFLAMTAHGLVSFSSASEACAASDQYAMLPSIYAVQAMDYKTCCEMMYTDNFSRLQAACEDKPVDWACKTELILKRLKCVSAPTFTTVEEPKE